MSVRGWTANRLFRANEGFDVFKGGEGGARGREADEKEEMS